MPFPPLYSHDRENDLDRHWPDDNLPFIEIDSLKFSSQPNGHQCCWPSLNLANVVA